jgi:hypothetical protein
MPISSTGVRGGAIDRVSGSDRRVSRDVEREGLELQAPTGVRAKAASTHWAYALG